MEELLYKFIEFECSKPGRITLIVILLVRAIMIGLVAFWIAEERKKNKILCFLFAFLFGPFALFIIYIATYDWKSGEENKIWICEKCETENTGDICKNCGAPKSKIIV